MQVSFAADELGLVLCQATRTVQCRLVEARRVRGLLPKTWAAFLEGTIDGYRVSLVAGAAGKLNDNHGLIHLDHEVVAYACTHTTAQVRAWLGRFVARSEPDQATQRAKAELSRRSVWVQHGDDGVSFLQALLPTTDAVRIDNLLTAEAKKLPADDRSLENKRADLLVDRLFGGDRTGMSRPGVVMGVTIPVTSLAGVTGEPGESFDGRFALPAGLVRELATAAGTLFHRIITDPLGRILDVTEIGRFASDKLDTALAIRDGTCAFPTCARPAQECDDDHVQPHPRGPTTGANLRNLCRRHHNMKTLGIVTTSMNSAGHHWHLPTGQTITSETQTQPTTTATTTSRRELDLAHWLLNLTYAA